MILGEESIKNMWYISMVTIKYEFSYYANVNAMQIQEATISV